MREWSSLTDAFLDWLDSSMWGYHNDTPPGKNSPASRLRARNDYARSRGVPSIFM